MLGESPAQPKISVRAAGTEYEKKFNCMHISLASRTDIRILHFANLLHVRG
jgi:hypothetical protein